MTTNYKLTKCKTALKRGFLSLSSLLLLILLSTMFSVAQNQYQKLCLKGFSAEDNHAFDEAIKNYSEAINLKPAKADGYGYRANAYYKKGRVEDAITDASKAIFLKPTLMVLYELRGNCHMEIKNYDKAIADFSHLITSGRENSYSEIYPIIDGADNYRYYFKRAKALYANKQLQYAVNDLTHAIALGLQQKNQTVDLLYWRAQCYIGMNKHQEAIQDLEQCMPTYSSNINANFYLGLSYLKTGNSEKASHYARKIIELDLSNEKYFSGDNLLSIYDLENRRSKAAAYFAHAHAKIEEFKNVTSSYFLTIKANEAFQYLDSAWFISPKLDEADNQLRARITEAYFTVYPKLKEKPEVPEIARKYIVQALNATEERNYNKAIGLWNKVMDITPYNPMAYFNKALLLEFDYNYGMAIAVMKKYLKLAPDDKDARGAQDKIYLWESKSTSVSSQSNYLYNSDPVITSKLRKRVNESLGDFHFAFALGGDIGCHFGNNAPLANYWDNKDGHLAKEYYQYGGNFRVAYGFEYEVVVRPVSRLAFGHFGRIQGGLGKTETLSEKHRIDLTSLQMGGFARAYLMLNDMRNTLDLYLQFKYGINTLNGYYDRSTKGIVSYNEDLSGKAPILGFGFGFGGKAGKVSYLTMEIEYFSSLIEKIDAKITVNNAAPTTIGTKTTLSNVSVNYNGVMLKLLLIGFCF